MAIPFVMPPERIAYFQNIQNVTSAAPVPQLPNPFLAVENMLKELLTLLRWSPTWPITEPNQTRMTAADDPSAERETTVTQQRVQHCLRRLRLYRARLVAELPRHLTELEQLYEMVINDLQRMQRHGLRPADGEQQQQPAPEPQRPLEQLLEQRPSQGQAQPPSARRQQQQQQQQQSRPRSQPQPQSQSQLQPQTQPQPTEQSLEQSLEQHRLRVPQQQARDVDEEHRRHVHRQHQGRQDQQQQPPPRQPLPDLVTSCAVPAAEVSTAAKPSAANTLTLRVELCSTCYHNGRRLKVVGVSELGHNGDGTGPRPAPRTTAQNNEEESAVANRCSKVKQRLMTLLQPPNIDTSLLTAVFVIVGWKVFIKHN